MKEYLISVIWVSIIVGICELLSPHSEGIKKSIKAIGALCILCVVIGPIVSLTNLTADLGENIKNEILEGQDKDLYREYEELLENYLTGFSEDAVKSTISQLLNEKFSIPAEESDVIIFTEIKNDVLTPVKLQILLTGGSIFKNPYDIEEYFSKLIGCKCEVLIN